MSPEIVVDRLVPVGRHDSARLLAFVGAHAVPGVEAWDGRTWTSSLHGRGGPAVVEVTLAPEGTAGFDVRLTLTDPADEPGVRAALAHLLDLDGGVGPAERVLGRDPLLRPLLRRRPGLRGPGVVDPFETFVRTVVGQQVSVAGARTVTGRLVAAAGERLPAGLTPRPEVTHTFPRPAVLATLSPDDGALAMPRTRAAAIVSAAALFAATPDGTPGREELLAVPGIGPWTVDYVDLRVRRDPDVLMATDLAVRRAVQRLGGGETLAAVRATAEAWRPFRSTALMHLWAEYLGL